MDDRRKKDLFVAADRLFAHAGRVSLRKLTPLLKGGGSNREVGPALREWKALREYQPALKPRTLPVPVQAALAKSAGELWAAAQAEAAAALTRDREHLAATLRAGDEILAEALDRLDAAEVEMADLRRTIERLEGRHERVRSEEFWDRVMREVYQILPATGTMTAAQILPLLGPVTLSAAYDRREPLTARTLRKKMAVRVAHGRYFTGGEEGHFARGGFPAPGRGKAAAPPG